MSGSIPAAPSNSSPVILLVETREPGNLGACARAMMNMGLQRLRLLNPCDTRHPQCRALAGKAYSIIEQAELCRDWDEAVADIHILVGTTSARERLLERPVLSARTAATQLAAQTAASHVGFVFGPERTGLTDWHLARCQVLSTVPAAGRHPVLNLAQAVMVFCYEIYQAWKEPLPTAEGDLGLATQQQRRQMFQQAQRLLTRVGFLSASQPEPIMSLIRNLLREDLTAREVRTIRGMLSQIEWFVETGHKLPPDRVRRK